MLQVQCEHIPSFENVNLVEAIESKRNRDSKRLKSELEDVDMAYMFELVDREVEEEKK